MLEEPLRWYIDRPRDADKHQKLRSPEKILPYKFQRERGPASTLILDVWPPEPWDDNLLLFNPPRLRPFVRAAPNGRVWGEDEPECGAQWLWLWSSEGRVVPLRWSPSSRQPPLTVWGQDLLGLQGAQRSKDSCGCGHRGLGGRSVPPCPPLPSPLSLIPQSLTDIKTWQGILPPALVF